MNNKYTIEEGQIVDTETGQIVNKEEIQKAIEQDTYETYLRNADKLFAIGSRPSSKIVKDKRGNEHNSYNVKEGYHFVKVFKVDVRNTLESCDLSIYSRAFLYSCLAYLNFPTNTIVIDGESPTLEVLCKKFKLGKTKMYEVFKELEKIDLIKRKKINGQLIIYINPFLHSCGLVDSETYNLFKDSLYNPINRGIVD